MKNMYNFICQTFLLLILLGLNFSSFAQQASALQFDGLNDRVILPSTINSMVTSTNQITIESWINYSQADDWATIVTEGFLDDNKITFFIHYEASSDGWRAGFYNNGTFPRTNPITIPKNVWSHIAVTYDQLNIKVYLNGVLVTQKAVTSPLPMGVHPWRINSRWDELEVNNFIGTLDEVRIWDRALTTGEILAQKDCELSGSELGLVAYYNFNQGLAGGTNTSETNLADFSGNGNHGTLNNFTLTGTASNWITPGGVVSGNTCPPCSFSSTSAIHVDADATGNNDGTSWADAFTDLQDALDAYCNNADVWVAAGTYKPSKDPFGSTTPTNPRDKTFFLPDGIQIYGGFAGTETMLSQRDIANNATILSGDIGTAGDNTDNSYNVVFASADASTGIGVTIDGFSITEGNANGSSNISLNGNNVYRNSGGGIYTYYGTNTLTNNTLYNNSATLGGGIWVYLGTNTLTNNTLYNNSASYGCGIYTNFGTNTLTNNTLYYNSASSAGGGIYIYYGTNTLTNNTLYYNSASSAGGGIWAYYGTNTLTNNIFWGNTVGGNNNVAGADIEHSLSTLTVEYCLTQENSTYSTGTGIINNQDPLFLDAANPTGADGIPGTADDGLALQSTSPAVDAGTTPSPTVPTDILGNSRVGNYDMGAYEYFNTCPFSATSPIHVDADATGNNDGTSWADAFTDLQDALDAYCNNADVWVAAGTYKPSKDPSGNNTNPRDKTFYLTDDIKIYGGFAGTESLLSERDIANNETILSGDIGTPADNTDNTYHVVCTSTNVTVDGFVITAGNANGSGNITTLNGDSFPGNYGGGIYASYNNGVSTFSNNIIYNNSTSIRGGGIATDFGTYIFSNNTIYNNSAAVGGGIYTYGSIFYNNTIHNNSASVRAGGIEASDGHLTLSNNIFWENKVAGDNNVVNVDIYFDNCCGGSVTVTNCLTQVYGTDGVDGNIVGQDPLFVNAANPDGTDDIAGTADDGLALQSCSPAINAGATPSPTIPTDILGNNRVGAYDMGAYENQNPTTINANATLAMADASVSLSQIAGNTYYANDCSSLIALVAPSGASPISGNVNTKVWFDATVSQLGQAYVQRHIEITPDVNAATATGTITLYFTQAEFNAFNADPTSTLDLPASGADATGIANLRITKFPGVSGDGTGSPQSYTGTPILIDPADANIVWNATMSRWEITFDVTSFSGFFVHTGNTPLPVELLDFYGRNDGKVNQLYWATASEENNKGFEIERSFNGRDFKNLGFVEGNGTTASESQYTFIDESLEKGIHYYRLKQLDFDGAYEYSEIIQIKVINESVLFGEIYPNPSMGSHLFLDYFSEKNNVVQISIFDVVGKIIQLQETNLEQGNHQLILDIRKIAAGTYIIQLNNGNSTSQRKIIVN